MIGNADAPRVTGTHVLVAMLSFFVIVSTVDAVMIYEAVSTFGGVENPNAYRDGLAYNDRIARQSRQNAMGWTDQAVLDEAGNVSISLRDSEGRPVREMLVSANVGRAATSFFDFEIPFAETSPGEYTAAFPGRGSGSWIADVRVRKPTSGDVVHQSRSRLWRSSSP